MSLKNVLEEVVRRMAARPPWQRSDYATAELAKLDATPKALDPKEIKATHAQARRARMIAILQACQCNYPVETFRNISGHRADCPAHPMCLEDVAERTAKTRGSR